ncbi:MAG: hypothetical protein AAB389_03115 [Patescibacteria group bacterium]
MAQPDYLKKIFSDLITDQRVSHGYIFFGHGVSPVKSESARKLANFLENGKWELSDKILLDCMSIDAGLDGGIDLMRAAIGFLWQKPVISSRRTFIIDNADALTLPAQNAILKIAEEPPASALIVLTMRDPGALLPAVQSRFQKIFVADLSPSMSADALEEAVKFLKLLPPKKKEYLKELIEQSQEPGGEKLIENFVFSLFAELDKEPVKNFKVLKALLHRWQLMNEFNVNKRLQLEAALLEI